MRDYGLIIEGRIVGFPDGQPIHCRDERTDLRPICLMAVEFSRVAFEDVDGDMLTEWRS